MVNEVTQMPLVVGKYNTNKIEVSVTKDYELNDMKDKYLHLNSDPVSKLDAKFIGKKVSEQGRNMMKEIQISRIGYHDEGIIGNDFKTMQYKRKPKMLNSNPTPLHDREDSKYLFRNSKYFQCDQCNYAATKRGNLNAHINAIHEQIKNFSCDQCEYASARRQDLAKHVGGVHSNI